MPCCTDRLSLMAGTYGSSCLSLVLTERLSLANSSPGAFDPESRHLSSDSEQVKVSQIVKLLSFTNRETFLRNQSFRGW